MKEERKDFDLINELPHIYELEDMAEFCNKYEHIYIYGRNINQEYLLKYLDICEIKVDGFVVSSKKTGDDDNFIYRKIAVKEIKDVLKINNVGIIIAISEKYYHQIIPMLRECEFSDYFIMTEYNKRAIAGQMKPRRKEVLGFEISMADHCNLSCQMCDHFSQISEPWFPDIQQFEKDIIQMGKLFNHECGPITLLGGEPLLNKDLIECIKIVRREFPKAVLGIMTNGILLLNCENSSEGNLWQACKDYNVRIEVTVYPIKLDYDAIEKKAAEYDIDLIMSSNIHAKDLTKVVKISDKHVLDTEGKVDKKYFINCLYFNKFNVLKDGKLYMCPIEAHINIFNKKFDTNITYNENDSLDIYSVSDWTEIAEWTSHYIPFCRHCDLKNWRHFGEWKSSSKQIDEYIDI